LFLLLFGLLIFPTVLLGKQRPFQDP